MLTLNDLSLLQHAESCSSAAEPELELRSEVSIHQGDNAGLKGKLVN